MELLVHGAMVERFERKKIDVKHRLNDMVDDLFAFMLSEVSACLLPLPTGPTPIATQTSTSSIVIPSDLSIETVSGSATSEIVPTSSHSDQNGLTRYCDSDSDCCCMECMDESMVKVEINDEVSGINARPESPDNQQQITPPPTSTMMMMMLPVVQRTRPNNNNNKSKKHRRSQGSVPNQQTPLRTQPQQHSEVMEVSRSSRQLKHDDLDDELDEEGEGDECENVPSNHQIETLGLKCYMLGCESMLEDRTKLNQHLYFDHDKILPYRCRVVGCGRMFDSRKDFWTHIRSGHTDYVCSICSVKFNGYFPFITHEFQLHEEGIFKCSREGCDFVAPIRDLVYKHTKTEHVKFVCNYQGCGQSFECYSYLKRHRRIHSQVKPYRCKWPGCGYSSTQCGAVIQHIRIRHFKLPSSVKKQKELNIIDHRNPNDYLEVLTELLN
ncbi:hypothetical protein RDWZM_008773 [Blomia tropicalis]|uniref:C2H2-type domain-containing protein n=1 Tax=Blomia tropicalis TaxID=40697 RepID=A0A9Q0RLR0_BLOTA|nr:hypothetical protein RDWZM_008773 [Blomia tropicalis]